MAFKEIKELIGLAMIGEGIVGLVEPKKYSLFWKLGFKSLEKLKRKAAAHPETMRLIYAAETCFGLWLAKSQLNSRIRKRQKRINLNFLCFRRLP